jgi:hypothetical protein
MALTVTRVSVQPTAIQLSDGRIDDGSVYEHDVRPDGFDGSVK